MPRCRLALVAWLALAAALPAAEPSKLLLVGQGPDNHPPGTHEYLAGVDQLGRLLADLPGLSVEIVQADEPWVEGPARLDGCDGALLFLSEGARWAVVDPRRHQALSRLADRQGGLLVLHWGMGTRAVEPIEPFLKLFGGCHGGPDRKYQVTRSELRPAQPQHPIAAGIEPLTLREEFYYRLKFSPGIEPVMQATIDGQAETVAWAWQRPDGGRSFGFSGLHFHDNWQHAAYRRLLVQAVRWTMALPDR